MKKIITKAFLFSLAIFSMTSCGDFLDQVPDERVELIVEKDGKIDYSTVINFLPSMYPETSFGWVCELSSDNVMDNNSPHFGTSTSEGSKKAKEESYDLQPSALWHNQIFAFEPASQAGATDSDSPGRIWSGFYNAIGNANIVLESIEKVKTKLGESAVIPEQLKAARAEALLVRAYCHFVLVNVFSQAYKTPEASKADVGVPYVKKTENDLITKGARGTVTETYENIQADLEEGLKDISNVNMKLPKWRFNVNAAHAFAARFYLYTRNYAKVIEHADLVLGEGASGLSGMLLNCVKFDDCVDGGDYTKVWQDPEAKNNLMLMDTYSIQNRYLGGRYGCVSTAARSIFYHPLNGLWSSSVNPLAGVAGYLFWPGKDYGYICKKVGEEFQYTDKLAGIGYAHIIQRIFTCNELLLSRAEAKVMLQDYAGAAEDLIAYEASTKSFSDKTRASYNIQELTMEKIMQIFSPEGNPNNKNKLTYNCFADWSFTQNMGSDFVVPVDGYAFMNCVNYYRRLETVHEGLRFFDLKRWGIEYSHVIGKDKRTETLKWNDSRRAIELPIEVLNAGLGSSREGVAPTAVPPMRMKVVNHNVK